MNTIPIELKGPTGSAALSDFSNVIRSLRSCLNHLSESIAKQDIEFEIVALRKSSAYLEIEPVPSEEVSDALQHEVVDVFWNTIDALENGSDVDRRLGYSAIRAFDGFSSVIRKSGNRLSIANQHVTAAYVANVAKLLEPESEAMGSVSGRLEAFSIHNKNEFKLYPPLGEEVECVFDRGIMPKVLDAVDKTVTVYGTLYYAKTKMFPVRVDVDDFDVHDEPVATLLNARGILKLPSKPSETLIRELRDEWQ